MKKSFSTPLRPAAALLVALIVALLISGCTATPANPAVNLDLQGPLSELQAGHPAVPGFAMAAVYLGEVSTAQTGVADPQGTAMQADTPVRIASITKTFVAAAVLRLWEQEKVDLDDSIAGYLSPTHTQLLIGDGYDPQAISVRHLLMHASGLNDHFVTDEFKQRVLSEPDHIWTRTEQLQMLVTTTDPRSPPGAEFFYSDSGYLLLGELIEKITGVTLAQAVSDLNRFADIGLTNTLWEGKEDLATTNRAHQYLDGLNTFGIHGSVDSFGGGGLIMSMTDVAIYFNALFGGRVFESNKTLELMTEAPGHPNGSPYRIGLFTGNINGIITYGHGGFWGTAVSVLPTLQLVIAGVSLEQAATQAYRHTAKKVAQSVIAQEIQ